MLTFAQLVAPSITRVAFQSSRLPVSNNIFTKIRQSCTEKKQNLLRFPAIPLHGTIEKFLLSVEPLLDEKELAETQKAAKEFLEKDGPQLQSLLQKVAEQEENWLANRWNRVAYLQYRDPVTVFTSPGMTFPIRKFCDENHFLDYTSKIIFAMLKYKEQIDCDSLPVAKMGDLELDNSQFKKVFGTCRLPKPKEDIIKYHPDSKHVIVLYKNHFYKFPVYNDEGQILCSSIIAKGLKTIMDAQKQRGTAFGILTTDFRDNWAKTYEQLSSSFENEAPLKEIETSLFTVNLDEEVESSDDNEHTIQAEQLIHGGGSSQNSGNRWMDKTIQLCVNPNGISGFCYEHSPAEGQPIGIIVDYARENLDCKSFFDEGATSNFEKPELLKIKSNPCIDQAILSAQQNVNKLAKDLHMHVLIYDKYGSEFIKRKRLSPDSYVQMAIQYAFYNLHKVPAATYESAHLRVYAEGRTETIRSCSNESVCFMKAMHSKDDNAGELLRTAVNTHKKYATEALMGRGVDRHLLGLKLMAIENKLPIPKFFQSPGIVKSTNFRLSTSQVASKFKAYLTYGPSTDDGYGCCYNPRNSSIILAISSWHHNKETCSDRFAKSLILAFDKMKNALKC